MFIDAAFLFLICFIETKNKRKTQKYYRGKSLGNIQQICKFVFCIAL